LTFVPLLISNMLTIFDIKPMSGSITGNKQRFLEKYINIQNSACGAVSALARCKLISPPENDSFRKDLCFSADVYLFLLECEISEMRGLTGVKFCTMVSTRPNFIMPVQNFGGAPQKNFRNQKHAKFGPISDNLEVRRRISPKRTNIFKIGFLFHLLRFFLR